MASVKNLNDGSINNQHQKMVIGYAKLESICISCTLYMWKISFKAINNYTNNPAKNYLLKVFPFLILAICPSLKPSIV